MENDGEPAFVLLPRCGEGQQADDKLSVTDGTGKCSKHHNFFIFYFLLLGAIHR